MKITMMYPPPSEEYKEIKFGYEPINTAPQTAHAVLSAYLRKYAHSGIDIVTVSDQEVTDATTNPPEHRNREVSGLIKQAADSDIIGMTCLFHNRGTALDIAKGIKDTNPSAKIVLGGQNVSNHTMAEMVLKQHPSIDYVVIGEGEEALVGIVDDRRDEDIPNLAYRDQGRVKFTEPSLIIIDKVPLWDFRDLFEGDSILSVYDSRTETHAKADALFKGLMPHMGIYSIRGCQKSAEGVNGGRKGQCSFCTTGGSKLRTISPDKFWEQYIHLYQTHGLKDFFIADDIFPLSPEYIQKLLEAKNKVSNKLPLDVNFRAYAYPNLFACQGADVMARNLKEIGVNNIFFGVETFDEEVSRRANKDHFEYGTVADALFLLQKHKIDSAIPLMPGLPGETEESLNLNYACLEKLLKEFGTKELGQGGLVRVDISKAMPIIGSPLYHKISNDQRIAKEYLERTGKPLSEDITPDYDLLSKLANYKIYESLLDFVSEATELCARYLKNDFIGGTSLQVKDIGR